MHLKQKYQKEIVPKMIEKFGYKNLMAVPKLTKVVINAGVGRNAKDKNFIDNVVSSLERISGQKPVQTKAKQSISAFKTRKGMIIGVAVTLRGQRMYDFMEKLINITFPRIRDFRGIEPNKFDGRGNFNLGLTEQYIFPEINVEKSDKARGMNITFVTTAKEDEHAKKLLEYLVCRLKIRKKK